MDCWPISCTMATCESGGVLIWGTALKRHWGAPRLKGKKSDLFHLYLYVEQWIIQRKEGEKELPSQLCNEISWIQMGSILSKLITVRSHGGERGGVSWCESKVKRPRAAVGDIFLCYLHWPIRRPIEGGSAVCMCVCKKKKKKKGCDCTKWAAHTLSLTHTYRCLTLPGKKGKGRRNRKRLSSARFRFFPPRERDVYSIKQGAGKALS